MLKWIKEFIIHISVGIGLSLFDDSLLNGGDGPFVVMIDSICSLGPKIFRKRFFIIEGPGLDKSGVGAGVADQIVIDSKGKRSYIAPVHSKNINS